MVQRLPHLANNLEGQDQAILQEQRPPFESVEAIKNAASTVAGGILGGEWRWRHLSVSRSSSMMRVPLVSVMKMTSPPAITCVRLSNNKIMVQQVSATVGQRMRMRPSWVT